MNNKENSEIENFTMLQQGPIQGVWDPKNLVAASLDAFGRLKVSNPFTLFDSFHRYRANQKFSTALSGGGSTTYSTNESVINMGVGTSSGDYVYRESKLVFPYQPGKSFLTMNTFVFSEPQENLRQRIGLFSTYNGVYLEQDGLTTYFVIRTYVSGNIQYRRVAQEDWNGHKFDGSPFYQINLDVTKANIVWFDIEWLGVGDVRCGFVVHGSPIVAHTFHNDNVNLTTYMTTATLPVRQEIENTGTTTSSASAKQICSTVISEGGYQGLSPLSWAGTGIVATSAVTLATPGTFYPIVSIRLKSDRLDAVVLPNQLDILATSNDNYLYELRLNAELTGTSSWTSYSTFSSVEYDLGSNGISTTTPGTTINAGIGYLKTGSDLKGLENFNFQLGRTIQGTSDTLTLVVKASGENAKIHGGIGWFELV